MHYSSVSLVFVNVLRTVCRRTGDMGLRPILSPNSSRTNGPWGSTWTGPLSFETPDICDTGIHIYVILRMLLNLRFCRVPSNFFFSCDP